MTASMNKVDRAYLYKQMAGLLKLVPWGTNLIILDLVICSPFYWAGFVAQRERAQQDFIDEKTLN